MELIDLVDSLPCLQERYLGAFFNFLYAKPIVKRFISFKGSIFLSSQVLEKIPIDKGVKKILTELPSHYVKQD